MNGLLQSSKKRIDLTTSPLSEDFLTVMQEVEKLFVEPSNISSGNPKKKKKKKINSNLMGCLITIRNQGIKGSNPSVRSDLGICAVGSRFYLMGG
jgi:hypothetical protein